MSEIYTLNWRDIDPESDEWPCRFFTPYEVRDRRTGEVKTTKEFLSWMDALRDRFGKPIIINSWYRSPASNAEVSTTGIDGAHTTGLAVDIKVSHADAFTLVALAISMGCRRIGLRQTGGASSRFVHLDLDPSKPSPRIWTYR